MVKKVGQRKFLLKSGYTDEQLNKMTPHEAHALISALEKVNREKREAEQYTKEHFNELTMEDKRLKEIKDKMYKVVCSSSYNLQVEAAKAYAMLCMAENGQATVTTVNLGDCNVR